MNNPREWWIAPTKDMNGVEGVGVWPIEELPDLFTKHTVGVHVIEKSAYDALKEGNELLVHALNKIASAGIYDGTAELQGCAADALSDHQARMEKLRG